MVECEICLEEYREGELELHRESCVVRLIFRCSLCKRDYVSKEGLWNHLDLHQIVDENKELHHQEINAIRKLHQCVLCNDQRAYSQSSYWKHVHDAHDGFFLRCSNCGENFRSKKLKNDHASSHCKARDRTEREHVPFEVENKASDAEHLKLLGGEQSSAANEGIDNRLNEQSELRSTNSVESTNLQPRFPCDICGITFSSEGLLLHKEEKYTCMEGGQQKCPHCWRVFQMNEFQAHLLLCENRKFSCELCPLKFKTSGYLARHKRTVHRSKKVSRRAGQKAKASSSNVVGDGEISTTKKDTSDKSVQLLVKQTSSRSSGPSSGTKCFHCDKECSSSKYLRQHIVKSHQPVKCRICRIICQGYDQLRYHEIKWHTEPKYDCPTCGRKFHHKYKYDIHCRGHAKRFHTAKKSSNNIPVDQDEKQDQDNDLKTKDVETLPSQPHSCNICGVTCFSRHQLRYHKLTKHMEGKLQCSQCPRKFHRKHRLEEHASRCADLKHFCDLCGAKFNVRSRVENHKKRFHQGSRLLRNSKIEGVDCTKEKTQNSVKKIDVPQETTSCIICRIPFASTDELLKHMLTCTQPVKEHDDSPNTAEQISQLHIVQQAQSNSTIVPRDESIEIKLEINVEETMLQEQEYPVSNKDPECSLVTTTNKPPDANSFGYVPVKTCSFEDAKSFVKTFEFGFGWHVTHNRDKGNMRHYRCIRVKQKARPQCDRKVAIFTPEKEKSTVYAKGEHTCQYAPSENLTRAKLTVEQADMIRKLVRSGVSTKNVKKHAKLMNAKVTEKQLDYAIKKASKQLYGSDRSTLDGENVELKMEIKVEETTVQNQDSYQNQERSFAIATTMQPDDKLQDVATEDTEDLENGIKVKEEYLEDEIIT